MMDYDCLARWRFHDLRHCTASWLVMAGVSLPIVAKILGHKELTTTQRYAHLLDSSLVDAIDRIQYGIGSECENNVRRANSGEVQVGEMDHKSA